MRTVCVLMTKRQLEKYIDLLDCRIEYWKLKGRSCDQAELDLLVSMRNHTYESFEDFKK